MVRIQLCFSNQLIIESISFLNLSRFLFLFLENFGVRKLELLFCVFIGIMALSFAWMFGETNPDIKAVASGALISLLNSSILQNLFFQP